MPRGPSTTSVVRPLGADAPERQQRPNRYEVATGLVVGRDLGGSTLPSPGASPRRALERAVVDALTRPPCVVSFSGGRDSSAILAVATHAARRHGLAPPVPVTLRFPGPESDESRWQEHVVRHLRLDQWERIPLDEIDVVGPVATRVLERHGVLWPANAHFHVPMLARATSGSLLTGIDGDVLFGGWRWAPPGPGAPARSRVSPLAAYAGHATFSALPDAARKVVARRAFSRPEWIHRAGWREVTRYLASVWELEPRRWDARIAWWYRRRYLAYGRWSLSLLAADHDVRLVHPFLDPAFVAALAQAGGRRGYRSRTEVMTALVGDLLPPPVLSRETKATFDTAIWGEHSREFIQRWDGAGVDASLVEVPRLRREWQKPVPHFHTATLLQTAWLHAHGVAGDGETG